MGQALLDAHILAYLFIYILCPRVQIPEILVQIFIKEAAVTEQRSQVLYFGAQMRNAVNIYRHHTAPIQAGIGGAKRRKQISCNSNICSTYPFLKQDINASDKVGKVLQILLWGKRSCRHGTP